MKGRTGILGREVQNKNENIIEFNLKGNFITEGTI